MAKRGLSKNEKMVLYGLVRYPLLNDRELAETLNLKMSTVATIRNRLKRRGYFFTTRVPMLHNINAELLTVAYGNFTPGAKKVDMEKIGKVIAGEIAEANLVCGESYQAFSVGIARNYTEVKKSIESFERTAIENGIYDQKEGFNFVFLPYSTSKVYNYFNYSTLLANLFGIKEHKHTDDSKLFEPYEYGRLTEVEKRVLYGLIKYPDTPDYKIAEAMKVSRHVVAKTKARFEKEKITRSLRIPDLSKLGFDILALTHIKFDTSKTTDKRTFKKTMDSVPQVLLAMNNSEGIALTAYRNFAEYQEARANFIRDMKKEEFAEPKTMLFSLSRMKILKNHQYTPAVDKSITVKFKK